MKAIERSVKHGNLLSPVEIMSLYQISRTMFNATVKRNRIEGLAAGNGERRQHKKYRLKDFEAIFG